MKKLLFDTYGKDLINNNPIAIYLSIYPIPLKLKIMLRIILIKLMIRTLFLYEKPGITNKLLF